MSMYCRSKIAEGKIEKMFRFHQTVSYTCTERQGGINIQNAFLPDHLLCSRKRPLNAANFRMDTRLADWKGPLTSRVIFLLQSLGGFIKSQNGISIRNRPGMGTINRDKSFQFKVSSLIFCLFVGWLDAVWSSELIKARRIGDNGLWKAWRTQPKDFKEKAIFHLGTDKSRWNWYQYCALPTIVPTRIVNIMKK